MESSLSLAVVVAGLMLALRCGFALLFIVSGIGKLRHRARWTEMLSAYRLVPDTLLVPVAWGLPVLEIGVALGLATGFGLAVAATTGAVLMLVFAAAIGINLRRGRLELDCGCNPAARPQKISVRLMLRNMALAGPLLACMLPMPAMPMEFAISAALAGGIVYLLFHVLAMLRGFSPATAPEPR